MNAQKLDKIILNQFTGIPIFFLIMWGVFQTTFTLGAIPMTLMDNLTASTQEYLATTLPPTQWSSLIIDGIIGGIGAMLTFLPLIILLFFFLSVLQQTGYINRVAQLFETIFKKIGLRGESIIPLIMGYGCNVPAIMAVKHLKTKREKIITTMMIPFLSCSATLPVFTLLIAAFFEEKWRGTILFGLYLLGSIFAALTGLMLNKTMKEEESIEVSNLPKYTLPKIKTLVTAIWNPLKNFTIKAGKIILPFSILMWILFSFPQTNNVAPTIENSYAGQISMAIEPIFSPIGFDWKIIAGLLGALGAKEVFISTFGILYSIETSSPEGLINALQNDHSFTPLIAIVLLLFMLIYSPCIPVIATIKEQFGNRWAALAFIYPTALAWLVCFLVYQIGSML